MIRLCLGSLFFLLFVSVEFGFVYTLPFPLDRTPFVLIVSTFAFQPLDFRQSALWVLLFGLVLDLTRVSPVPFESFSYAVASIVLVASSRHLFSNRSFWGILGTFTLSLLALTFSEIILSVASALLKDYALSLKELLVLRSWSWVLGVIVLLFLFPLHEFLIRIRHTLFAS